MHIEEIMMGRTVGNNDNTSNGCDSKQRLREKRKYALLKNLCFPLLFP
jgi:hypothetical protein